MVIHLKTKLIDGFDIPYFVSDTGQVFNAQTGEEVEQHFIFTKTRFVQLIKNGEAVNKKVAYLVANAFVDNPHGFCSVRHRDGNRQNNAASNLYWTRRTRKGVDSDAS